MISVQYQIMRFKWKEGGSYIYLFYIFNLRNIMPDWYIVNNIVMNFLSISNNVFYKRITHHNTCSRTICRSPISFINYSTNTIQPLIDQNIVNASTKVTSFSSSFYNKSTPTSSFKVDNSTSLILNKTA